MLPLFVLQKLQAIPWNDLTMSVSVQMSMRFSGRISMAYKLAVSF